MSDSLRDANAILVEQSRVGAEWLRHNVTGSRRSPSNARDWRLQLLNDQFRSHIHATFHQVPGAVRGQASKLHSGGSVGLIVVSPPEDAPNCICVLYVQGQVKAGGLWSQLQVITGFFHKADTNTKPVSFYGFRFETPSSWIGGQQDSSKHNYFHVQMVQSVSGIASDLSWPHLNTSAPAIPLSLSLTGFIEIQLLALAMASLHGEKWFERYLQPRSPVGLSVPAQSAIKSVRDSVWQIWAGRAASPIVSV